MGNPVESSRVGTHITRHIGGPDRGDHTPDRAQVFDSGIGERTGAFPPRGVTEAWGARCDQGRGHGHRAERHWRNLEAPPRASFPRAGGLAHSWHQPLWSRSRTVRDQAARAAKRRKATTLAYVAYVPLDGCAAPNATRSPTGTTYGASKAPQTLPPQTGQLPPISRIGQGRPTRLAEGQRDSCFQRGAEGCFQRGARRGRRGGRRRAATRR